MIDSKPIFYSITDGTPNESNAKAFVNWFSLIWTVRFGEHGEFELKTYDIENGLKALPLYAIVFIHTDSSMMMVEDHEIGGSKDGDILTVSGRTLDAAWFSGRTTVHDYVPNFSLWNASKTPQAFLNDDVMLGSAVTPAGESLTESTYSVEQSANDLYSAFVPYTTERTDVYSEIEKMCKTFRLGVRSLRPSTAANRTHFRVYGEQNRETQILLSDSLGHFGPNKKLYTSTRDEFHEVIVLDETTERSQRWWPEYAGITDYKRRIAVVWSPQVPEGADKIAFYDQYANDFLHLHKRQYLYECSLSPFGINTLIESYMNIGEWPVNTTLSDKLGNIFSIAPKYYDGVLKMRLQEIVRSFGKDGANTSLTMKQVF